MSTPDRPHWRILKPGEEPPTGREVRGRPDGTRECRDEEDNDEVGAADAPPVLRFTFGFWTSTSWTDRRELSWPELTEVLTKHQVGQKEGDAIVPATFRGDRRSKTDAEEIYAAFLDSDTGCTLAEIEASVRARGWAAVISSSYSHLTTQTKVNRSNVDKFKHDNPHSTDADFLVNDKGMLPRVAAGARVAETDDKFVYFEHQPCPKFRVAIRLLRPWRADDYPTQDVANAAWKERIEALAAALGLQHDQSCTDTSRLFYLPRQAKNAPPPETCVIDGDPCDLFAIPAAPRDDQLNVVSLFGGGNSQGHPDVGTGEFVDPDTGEVFDLRAWAVNYGERFKIAKALGARKPDMLTGLTADNVKVHCRCPNERRHTNAGADAATFVVNAGDSNNGGFVVHCRHSHCTGMDRLAFVGLMLKQRWLSIADLTAPDFLVPIEAEDPPPEAPHDEPADDDAPTLQTEAVAKSGTDAEPVDSQGKPPDDPQAEIDCLAALSELEFDRLGKATLTAKAKELGLDDAGALKRAVGRARRVAKTKAEAAAKAAKAEAEARVAAEAKAAKAKADAEAKAKAAAAAAAKNRQRKQPDANGLILPAGFTMNPTTGLW